MKKIYKISSFLIFIICLLVLPRQVRALSTGIKSIDEEIKVLNDTDSSMQFSKIKFNIFSNTTELDFGFAGIVYNGNMDDRSFLATATYYTEDMQEIAKTTTNQFVPSGEFNSYSHMASSKEIKSGYNVYDIKYYKLDIDTHANINTGNKDKLNNFSNLEYVIDNYDVHIDVKENNVLEITEKISAYFNVEKHGIFRKIPLRNKVERLDGSYSYNRVKIKDIKVDNPYSLSNDNGYKVIKIGSSGETITGSKDYTISYSYNLGKDPVKNYDELYFNLIGTEWDTEIKNVTFTINMPKEFDEKKLGFSSGKEGSTDSSHVKFKVTDKVITGNLDNSLNIGEGLTIRLELPDGYFVGASNNLDIMMFIALLLPIIFLAIAIFMWYKFGKDDKVVETVEFYPPEGFNSLEVGFAYNGKAESKDVISLLIYLANKGYLKIEEFEEKALFTNVKSFKIIKLKEYDGTNENERCFLSGLFKMKNEVTKFDLQDNFYMTTYEILKNINSSENKNHIFEKGILTKKIMIFMMIIATFCLITIPPIFIYSEPSLAIFGLLFPGIGFSFMFGMLFSKGQTIYVNGRACNSLAAVKVFAVVWGLMFGGMPWLMLVFPVLVYDYIYLVIYFIGLVCAIGMIICIVYLPKRTKYGNELLGKIKGFRTFLETAEKEKLEAMVMENPTYFYDILPYTYVLGISNIWIKKFEDITIAPPIWYDSPGTFTINSFDTFFSNTMSMAQSSMSTSSVSGGGSSGGGSSGGGSGGGGGGSW